MAGTGGLRSPVAVIALLGAAGSVAVAVASYAAGALPTTWTAHRWGPPLYLAGLAGLSIAWLALGHRLAGPDAPGLRTLRLVAAAWAAPMLAALPIGSRDLYAYLAQARLAVHGHDPYAVGPSVLHDLVGVQVSARWQHVPSPYGPLWVLVSKAGAGLTGTGVVAGVVVLRLLALLGLVLLAATLPRLTAAAGGRPNVATWLVVANPLVLVSVLGGGHNDLLMVGLLVAGLATATRPGGRALAAGAVLVTAAALVKAPAAAALPFLVPVWWGRRAPAQAPAQARSRSVRATVRELVRPYVVVLVAAAATLGVVTLAAGVGFGWVGQLGRNRNDPYGWLSLVNPFVYLFRRGPIDPASGTVKAVDVVAAALSLAVLVVAWLRAHRGRPLAWLTLGLTVLFLLAPTIRPWYACWPLAVVAVALRPGRWVLVVAGLSVLVAFGTGPEGNSRIASVAEIVAALLVVALGVPAWRRAGPQPVSG